MKEQELISALRQNQRLALRQIFDLYYENLVQRLYRLIPDQPTAEGLVQGVFAELWERRLELELQQSLKDFLHGMAMDQGLSYLRKQKSEKEPFTEATSVEPDVKDADLQQKIQAALASLPLLCRKVFVLSRYEGLSYQSIAEKLEVSMKTVEKQLAKALERMAEHLKG